MCRISRVGLLVLPESGRRWTFLLMALLKMCVPLYLERGCPTSWHPHHIAERCRQFTSIVPGGTVAVATIALRSGIDEFEALDELLPIALGGLLIVSAVSWICFTVPIHGRLRARRQAFLWDYGHYVVFASAAGIGTGLEDAIEQAVGKARLPALSASAVVTLPTALSWPTVPALRFRHFMTGLTQQPVLPVTALLVICCAFLGEWAVPAAGLVTVSAATTRTTLMARAEARANAARPASAG